MTGHSQWSGSATPSGHLHRPIVDTHLVLGDRHLAVVADDGDAVPIERHVVLVHVRDGDLVSFVIEYDLLTIRGPDYPDLLIHSLGNLILVPVATNPDRVRYVAPLELDPDSSVWLRQESDTRVLAREWN